MLKRIELYTAGVSAEQRAALLEVIYQVLRISPGMVSASGEYELQLRPGDLQEDPPVVVIAGRRFSQVTPERLRTLIASSR